MTEKRKLAVVVHGNDDVTVYDERGVPVLCRDCRLSGWLTELDFNDSRSDTPSHCLHFSGGAEPTTGERASSSCSSSATRRSRWIYSSCACVGRRSRNTSMNIGSPRTMTLPGSPYD